MQPSCLDHAIVRRMQLEGLTIGDTVRHRLYDGEFLIARIETHPDDGPLSQPFKLRSTVAQEVTQLQGRYGTYGDTGVDPHLWLAAGAQDLAKVVTEPVASIVLRRERIKAPLGALGVAPGWFCRWAGCDIWFEVLAVFDNSVRVVARNPEDKVNWAYAGDHFAAIDALINHRPTHGHWIDTFRNKSFYDKFHPELWNLVE